LGSREFAARAARRRCGARCHELSRCLYLQPRVGESFDATITSALEFGLFVQLKEMPIDGLVHISAIPGDYWELDRGGMGLVGQRTGGAGKWATRCVCA
jgi:ribonuclease R